MKKSIIEKGLYKRYLDILGVKIKQADIFTLNELIKRHLKYVPFENISKLYYKKILGMNTIPDFKLYLEGIENFHFGGTCYTNNYYFFNLLSNLGFDAKFCSADMSNPDVHSAIIVTINRQEYLVDVGYAAPMNLPVPLYLKKDFELSFGLYRYVIIPKNSEGNIRIDMHYDGEKKHGYLLKPKVKDINDFKYVIHDSFSEKATFMNSVLLTKTVNGNYLRINNYEYSESNLNKTNVIRIKNKNEIAEMIEKVFFIPAKMTKNVIDDINLDNRIFN